MVMDAPDIETVLPKFLAFVGDAVLVAHNASFNVGFVFNKIVGIRIGYLISHRSIGCDGTDFIADTFKVQTERGGKCAVIFLWRIIIGRSAVPGATTEIFVKFVEMLRDRNVDSLRKLNQLELTMQMQCVSFRLIMSLFLPAMR